jgi:hypothetical protein
VRKFINASFDVVVMVFDDDLLSEYKELQGKFSFLPDFELLARDFDVERVLEKDSSFLLREIRRLVVEKYLSFVHLFESFLYPSGHSVFVFSLVKGFDDSLKSEVKALFDELSSVQLSVIVLDTVYDERKEADFVAKLCSDYQKLKFRIVKVLETLDSRRSSDVSGKSSAYLS